MYINHSFTKKIQKNATVYQNFISYLYEAQHVSSDTSAIIRSPKLHQQPLVLHTWRVVGRVVAGRWQRCVARHMLSFIWIRNKYFDTLLHLVGFSLWIIHFMFSDKPYCFSYARMLRVSPISCCLISLFKWQVWWEY